MQATFTPNKEAWEREIRALIYSCLPSIEFSAVSTVSEWALKKRRIAPSQSFAAKRDAIPYILDWTPYADHQMRSFTDPAVQTTVMMQAADTGKTETINNCVGFCIDEEPSRQIILYPIDKSAEAWSKEHLAPMIEYTPCLRGRVGEAKSRDSTNTIGHKVFPGGSISVIAGNSPSNFRLRRARVVIADEIDALAGSVRDEGDPITLLFKRSEGYEDSIQILSSTPKTKGKSRIENWLNKSDYNEWWVPCQKCRTMQTLKWKNFIWPKGRHEECRWHCEECNHRHTPQERVKAVQQGEWRARNPFSGVRGYWLPGYYSIFPAKKGYSSKEHQMAMDAHDAKHSENPKETVRAWTNTFLCETYEEEEDMKPEWAPLLARREAYSHTKVPKGVVLATVGADLQEDRIECEIVGYGPGQEAWGIRYAVFMGDPTKEAVWNALDAFLSIPIKREDGKLIPICTVGIDTSAPKPQSMAYDFIRPRQSRGWLALKGSSQVDYPAIKRSEKSKVTRVKLMSVGVNIIKGWIYDRAINQTPGTPGYLHFPIPATGERGYDETWFQQLFSESSYPVYKSGVRWRQFECPKNVRNEGLDCRVYSIAALHALGPVNWEARELQLKPGDIEPVKTDPKPIQNRGFVGISSGWTM